MRTSEGFVETFGPNILARIGEDAPGVRLRFLQKPDKESTSLRDGTVDLETGVIDDMTSPEARMQSLFRDCYVGVVRLGHPLCDGKLTPSRYVAGTHVVVSRGSRDKEPLDEAMKPLGLERKIGTVVGGFATALALARASNLIASVPERHTAGLRDGLRSFPLPFPAPEFTVSMLWHPRMDGDLAHRWLRGRIRDACIEGNAATPIRKITTKS